MLPTRDSRDFPSIAATARPRSQGVMVVYSVANDT